MFEPRIAGFESGVTAFVTLLGGIGRGRFVGMLCLWHKVPTALSTGRQR